MSNAYKNAGVDIDAGTQFVEHIKSAVKSTARRGVVTDIGGYGGLFSLDVSSYPNPILVSGTDGVGTKVLLAIEQDNLSTIGIDLVAMCINDIACCGAEPLFFMDYFATGKLEPEHHSKIIEGIARGCKMANCALIGGETAEMPGLYNAKDFDLAGFAVGVVNQGSVIDGSAISASHAIIGISSSGFHSNGYSLVRKFISENKISLSDKVEGTSRSWGDSLLKPTKIYSPLMLRLAKNFAIEGFVHVTGGGFWDNIPRILPKGVKAIINSNTWEWHKETLLLSNAMSMTREETLRVFNCGIGLIMFAPKDKADDIINFIEAAGEKAYLIGTTAKRSSGGPPVEIK